MTGDMQIRVARLRTSEEYRAVVAEVEKALQDFKAGMEAARTDTDIVRLARYWQVTERVLRTLRESPEIFREIMAERLGDEDSI